MFLFDTVDGVEKPHHSDTAGGLCEAHGSNGRNPIESGPAWDMRGAGVTVVLLYGLIFARAGGDHSFERGCISADKLRLSTFETAEAAVVDWKKGEHVYAVLQREQ